MTDLGDWLADGEQGCYTLVCRDNHRWAAYEVVSCGFREWSRPYCPWCSDPGVRLEDLVAADPMWGCGS